MEIFRKHQWVWKIIVVIATVALIATSFLPSLSLLFQ